MSIDNDTDRIASGLFGRNPPDLQPLIDLLQSDRQIPSGVRDMLAQMIDPGSAGYLFFKLQLENTEGKVRNHDRDVKSQQIAARHSQLVNSGLSANKAADEVGSEFGLDPRSVYSRLKEAKLFRDWVKGKA